MKKLAGRVIDINEQGAFGTAVLEPPMMGPVDLDEFTEAVPSATWLIYPLFTFAAGYPQTGFRHPSAQSLFADRNLVKLNQLLSCQGRSEVVIVFTYQVQDDVAKLIAVTPITGLAALL